MSRIEGLSPWVSTGDPVSFLAIFAEWIDESGLEVEATLTVKQWAVRQVGDALLLPCLVVSVTYGPKDYKGFARVEVWRGADPRDFLATLKSACSAARKAHLFRKRHGTTSCAEETVLVMEAPG